MNMDFHIYVIIFANVFVKKKSIPNIYLKNLNHIKKITAK